MKTTNNDIKNILILIDKRINKLKTEKDTRVTIEKWMKIQNNLVEDFNNLIVKESKKSKFKQVGETSGFDMRGIK